MSDKREGSPAWLLEQNVKSNTAAAKAFRADVARYLEKAERAEALADEYREALQKLVDK